MFTKEAEAKITLSVVISLPPYDIVIGLHNINIYDLNYIVKAFIKWHHGVQFDEPTSHD